MSQLNISIYTIQDTLVVDSRLVADQLGVLHKNFKELIKTYIADFEEFGNLSVTSVGVKGTSSYAEFYYLNENQAYLSLTYSNNTLQVRRAKINLVKAFDEARKAKQPKLPGDYIQALEALLESEKEKANLLLLNAELAPKAEDWDSLCNDENYLSIEKIAKILAIKGMGRNNLFEWLRDKGILYLDGNGNNVPYQKYVESGYFVIRTKVNSHTNKTNSVTLATPKGFSFIKRRLIEDGYVLPPTPNVGVLSLPTDIAA
jgi:anti-repressor protein